MDTIISRLAVELPSAPLVPKYRGTPMAMPMLKQMSCRFVRLNSTLVLTLVRSLGTVT